jgi:hypothetical protein
LIILIGLTVPAAKKQDQPAAFTFVIAHGSLFSLVWFSKFGSPAGGTALRTGPRPFLVLVGNRSNQLYFDHFISPLAKCPSVGLHQLLGPGLRPDFMRLAWSSMC